MNQQECIIEFDPENPYSLNKCINEKCFSCLEQEFQNLQELIMKDLKASSSDKYKIIDIIQNMGSNSSQKYKTIQQMTQMFRKTDFAKYYLTVNASDSVLSLEAVPIQSKKMQEQDAKLQEAKRKYEQRQRDKEIKEKMKKEQQEIDRKMKALQQKQQQQQQQIPKKQPNYQELEEMMLQEALRLSEMGLTLEIENIGDLEEKKEKELIDLILDPYCKQEFSQENSIDITSSSEEELQSPKQLKSKNESLQSTHEKENNNNNVEQEINNNNIEKQKQSIFEQVVQEIQKDQGGKGNVRIKFTEQKYADKVVKILQDLEFNGQKLTARIV